MFSALLSNVQQIRLHLVNGFKSARDSHPATKFGFYHPLRTITCYQREHIQALQADAVFSQTSLLSNAQPNRMHSVASNSRGDSSPAPRLGVGTGAPAPRLGVGTGVGSPAPRLGVGTGVPAPRFGVGTGVGSPLLPSGLPRSFLHALLPPRPDPRPSSSRTLAVRLSMEHLPALRGHSPTPLHGTPLLPAPRWHYRGTLAAAFQRPTLGTGTPVSTPPGFGPPATTPAPTQPLSATPA